MSSVVPCFLWDDGVGDADVLEASHRRAEVVVLDVEAKVAGAVFGIGSGAVAVYFGVEHGDGGRAGVAGVIEFVTTGCHADAMGLGFLKSHVADEIGIRDFAVSQCLGFLDEEHGSGAFDLFGYGAICAEAMGE